MFFQESLVLKQCAALLALEHVRHRCVSSKRLLRGQGQLALLAFEIVLRSLVHFKRPWVVAFETAVFAVLLVGLHVASHLVPGEIIDVIDH